MKWGKLLCEKRQCKPSTSTETDMRYDRYLCKNIVSGIMRYSIEKTKAIQAGLFLRGVINL